MGALEHLLAPGAHSSKEKPRATCSTHLQQGGQQKGRKHCFFSTGKVLSPPPSGSPSTPEDSAHPVLCRGMGRWRGSPPLRGLEDGVKCPRHHPSDTGASLTLPQVPLLLKSARPRTLPREGAMQAWRETERGGKLCTKVGRILWSSLCISQGIC